ncbi:MAG TPA: hypothetical protein VH114_14975, partial [Candidatus Acidoferrum sp.]|nr:hypothetical protein [Candidatus Acidoferrum sp.]
MSLGPTWQMLAEARPVVDDSMAFRVLPATSAQQNWHQGATNWAVSGRLSASKEEIPMRRYLAFVLSSLVIPALVTAQA